VGEVIIGLIAVIGASWLVDRYRWTIRLQTIRTRL